MATRVELPIELVQDALTTKLASLKRSVQTTSNKIIKDVLEKELAAVTTAKANLTEIK